MPNQWTKSKETGVPYTMKEETKEKMRISAKETNSRRWDEEERKRHSQSMKRAVQENPQSYTSSNRGRTKQIEFDGVKFQGRWELVFYTYCKENSIEIERSNEWFEYEWNGTRKYFPDFYLPEKDIYVEVKGYETDRDRAKWASFPKSLKVVSKKEIDEIKKGTFLGL